MFGWLKRKFWEAWVVTSAVFTLYIYNPLARKSHNPLLSRIESNDPIAAGILMKIFPRLISLLNNQDFAGITPLRFAIYSGNTQSAKALILAGVDVNIQGPDGRNALYDAAYKNNLEVMQLLLAKGAIIVSQGSSDTPLHAASREGYLDAVRLLIQSGADVNYRDRDGNTSLHCAARSGNSRLVGYLIEKGGDVSILNKNEQAPINVVEKSLEYYKSRRHKSELHKQGFENLEETFKLLRKNVINHHLSRKGEKASSTRGRRQNSVISNAQKVLIRRTKSENLDYRSKGNSSGSRTP